MKEVVSSAPDKRLLRSKKIVRTSFIGIIANVFLVVFKALVGFFANSIAIILDAVNNLTDAVSSVVTIIGAKIARRPADRKHPYGHGRSEYLSAMVVALIVLYAGVTSAVESVKKTIYPETASYTWVTFLVISVAVVVKVLLGLYFRYVGKKINSDSLVNSGVDALFDSVISFSTIVAAIVFVIWHVSLEAYLGVIISLFIVKSGISMLKDTLSSILGERADANLAKKIKEVVCSFDGVSGAYDLVLNNYGPDVFNGSIHIEVPDTLTANEIDELNRKITYAVYDKCGVLLTAIGVYSFNTSSPASVQMREEMRELVFSFDNVKQMHGFYLNEKEKTIRFDLVIGFDEKNRQGLYERIYRAVCEKYPSYSVTIVADTDFSESL